jgi:hypothetical protein
LRVAKATTGQAPAGPFAFEVNCNHRPLNTSFTLEAGKTKDIANIPAGTICEVKETGTNTAKSTTIAETPSDSDADGKVTLPAGTQGIVTFTNGYDGEGGTSAPPNDDIPALAAAPGPAEVLGETLTAPAPAAPGGPDVEGATLPRTGADPTGLLNIGLWSLTAGGLALAAGRRRSRRG